MNLCVIGWYGTETLGDRAILAGIFSLFANFDNSLNISLGSLYPFFTRRTIYEDINFLEHCCAPSKLDISIFNSMHPRELKKSISACDMLIIGGGPLMDIPEMSMLEFALDHAKKIGRNALLLGVGWGPLHKHKFIACAKKIASMGKTVFRDIESANIAESLIGNRSPHSIDPAVFACEKFLSYNHKNNINRNNVCINFRNPTSEYRSAIDEEKFISLLNEIGARGKQIQLIPMHSFCVGVDDRTFLNTICFKTAKSFVSVVNNPPTLVEIMESYHEADFCIGMRFHSVVLQSCLNGKNLVLDYTDSKSGKIGNFCRTFLPIYEMLRRIRNVNIDNFDFDLNNIEPYIFPREKISSYREIYLKSIKESL